MSYLRPGHFELIAHRGGSDERPENTLLAFENAFKIHKDFIFELDVHRTRDGKIVCIHDDTVDRTTNGRGSIWDFNYSDLEKLDAAYSFSLDGGRTFPHRGQKIKIPLLSEVFERFPTSRVSIEIKHASPYFGRDIVKLVDHYQAGDRVVLAGSDHRILAEARGHGKSLCSGYSSREVLRSLIFSNLRLPWLARSHGSVLQVPINHGRIPIITPRFVAHAHRLGKSIHAWTINDETTMRHLISIGIDGIVTDAPRLLLRVAQELKKI